MDHRSDPQIRNLVTEDVPAALELSSAAGWNQTAADWRRLIELEPQGCLCIESDGRLAATTTMLGYGTDLAWIGMVLTHPDCQRRSYARRLMEVALNLAAGRGIRCIKLDATDQGRPLYASLGFEDEQPIERWRGEGAVTGPVAASTVPFDANLDREAFGADRSRFLQTLGFAACRPGARAHYLGPIVAGHPDEAEARIQGVLATQAGPWFWDLLPSNQAAVAIADKLGFTPVRRLVRMVRGPQIRSRDNLVYAIGGFEAG